LHQIQNRYLLLVGNILLVAGPIVCVILLIKAWFDRAESRVKKGKDDKKN